LKGNKMSLSVTKTQDVGAYKNAMLGSVLHTYSNGSSAMYAKQEDGTFVAPFSEVTKDQYHASQKSDEKQRFLLEIFK
tara:strand:- start:176 stop:409 length:234 start_codon:yes stop_codon:yes gene_type:complete